MKRLTLALFGSALFILPDAVSAQRTFPVELQIMPLKQNVRRHESTPLGNPTSANGTLSGVEASIMGASSGMGVFGRYLSGRLSGPKQRMVAEGGVMVGDKTFKIEIGYSERLYLPADSTLKFLRGGFNVTSFLGTSGVAVRLRGGYYAALNRFKSDKSAPDGWQGETSIAYTWDRVPVFAQIGYRIETLRGARVQEETSALTLGAGIWLWSR